MTILLPAEPPTDWVPALPGKNAHNAQVLSSSISASPKLFRVIETWEGLIDTRSDETVWARLLRNGTEIEMEFPVSLFQLGGPVEAGCTFEAQLVEDEHGIRRWIHMPHPVVRVPEATIARWNQEVAKFADSGL